MSKGDNWLDALAQLEAPIFSVATGASSALIRSKPRKGLGPKQIAWCRRRLAGFKQAERIAARVKREAEKAKERMGNANA